MEHKQENKICQNCRRDFAVAQNDFNFYKKMDVPVPQYCPECRYVRRLFNRNEWSLYKRACDLCKKEIISIYRADVVFPVYCHECWWSDRWDPRDYGIEYDLSKPFFPQFRELHDRVPHVAMVGSNNLNCQYCNQSQDNKECYMVSATNRSEKCMFGNWFQGDCFFCADCYMVEKFDYCYECISCARCSKCSFLQDCYDCVSSYFSIDCRSCNDCFGCVGLRKKSNCWFNEQLTKEEYNERFKKFFWTRENIEWAKKEMDRTALIFPRKFYHGANNMNSSGDYLENTAFSRDCFNVRHSKNTAYLQDAWGAYDCLDITEILGNELSYQIQGCAHIRNSIAMRSSFHMTDSYYCDMCNTLTDSFGCMSLRQKSYCILNKQYSKEEYQKLKNQIVVSMKKNNEWGDFFAPEIISPFAYNECVAYDYFPLTKKDALAKGYKWYDRPKRDYKITITADKLPKTIQECTEKILDEIIECESQRNPKNISPNCSTAFRIIEMELNFYRATGMPPPHKCPACRREDRFALRNPRKLWQRQCMCDIESHGHAAKCPIKFETSYAHGRPERVFCESCYNKEIY